MIEFEIDGQKVEADDQAMIIEAADQAGIYIPRYCYHKKLSIAANCRMCLIEVDGVPKALPACATPVSAGMKVQTRSNKALAAQRAVMEFLLINHPLDCPVCDQAGQCELQDISVGFGNDKSNYKQAKRSVVDDDLGPLIQTHMTRCIQCTRCVRFGTEIAGIRELGGIGRTDTMQISTYVKKVVRSELSGNIVDICPVGALTTKPDRYRYRAWEMRQHSAVSPHDCVGSNLFLQTRSHNYTDVTDVMRVAPRENEQVNQMWISDRDRFSYQALKSKQRVTEPMIKVKDKWQRVSWQKALNTVVNRITKIIDEHGKKSIAGLTSPNNTLEEYFLFQQLIRGLGSDHIDYRLRQRDFADQDLLPLFDELSCGFEALGNMQSILLVGSNIRQEQPLAAHRVRQAQLNGGNVCVINCQDYAFNFEIASQLLVKPSALSLELAQVLKALSEKTEVPTAVLPLIHKVTPEKRHQRLAAKLLLGESKAIVLGADAVAHPQFSVIKSFAQIIAETTGASFSILTDGANAAGAAIAGVLPNRKFNGQPLSKSGFNAHRLLTKASKAYFLLNVEPEVDSVVGVQAAKTLAKADCVIAMTPFLGEGIAEYADIILPIAAFSETPGTFVNAQGDWQSFMAANVPAGESRPAWKVLRVLGNLFDLKDFDYQSAQSISEHIAAKLDPQLSSETAWRCPSEIPQPVEGLERIGQWHMYQNDSLVRRASALQEMVDPKYALLQLNTKTAKSLQLSKDLPVKLVQADSTIELNWEINEQAVDDTVILNPGMGDKVSVALFDQVIIKQGDNGG